MRAIPACTWKTCWAFATPPWPTPAALAPALPWRQVVGTRNRLAHAYLGIDADTVWDIVANELPALRDGLIALLKQL